MPFDVDAAADRLAAWAAHPPTPPIGGWPAGAPEAEYHRTPVAGRVGHLAVREGLFLFHFERRAHLALPEAWAPPERPELADPPRWQDGVLEERKYQSFRHDLAVGSFHPLHRAKWTVHELCHGLVGFAWRPGASRFFHATAGRLAELLPVTLWYFLDEVFLARCPDHQGGGALFRTVCPACEAAAATVADDPTARERLADARHFLDRELVAIARSRRLGRPVAHRWATLDLCSDGLAYAEAHGDRLDSEAFLTFAARFLVEGGGWSPSLDDLEERVVEVARALVGEIEPRPLAPSPTHARWRWILQDVAWRLLVVQTQAGGPVETLLEDALAHLAGACDATRQAEGGPLAAQRVAVAALERAVEVYQAAHEAYALPDPQEVFAVGYEVLPGWGTDEMQVALGVRSAAPGAAHLLGEGLMTLLPPFLQADAPERAPLGVRWAAWLDREGLGPVADLARYESALRTAPKGDGVARALGAGGASAEVRLAPGAALHRFDRDVVGLAEAAAAGEEPREILAADWRADTWLVLLREPDDQVGVVALEPEIGTALAALGEGAPSELPEETLRALLDLGVLVPARWSETA